MAPYDLASSLGPVAFALAFGAIGFGFGAALEMGGFGDTRKLAGQFYFKDMTVLKVMFTGIPNFAPELFRRVVLRDPLRMKALQKGLDQLCEEGATQLFRPLRNNDLILGAVGQSIAAVAVAPYFTSLAGLEPRAAVSAAA